MAVLVTLENSMKAFLSRLSKVHHAILFASKVIAEFVLFLIAYTRAHLFALVVFLEGIKNILVHFFQMKRGRYSRPFLHFATILVIGLGVMITPLLADTFPLFAQQAQGLEKTPSP